MSASRLVAKTTGNQIANDTPPTLPKTTRKLTDTGSLVEGIARVTLQSQEPTSPSVSSTSSVSDMPSFRLEDSDSSSSSKKLSKNVPTALFEQRSLSPKGSIVSSRSEISVDAATLRAQYACMNEDEALIEEIINDKEDLSDALCLCSEEIIRSTKLISLIIKRVADTVEIQQEVKRTAPKTPEGDAALKLQQMKMNSASSLLKFCALWVRKNNGTPVFRECTGKLEELINICSKQTNEDIRALGHTLKKLAFEAPSKSREFQSKYAQAPETLIESALIERSEKEGEFIDMLSFYSEETIAQKFFSHVLKRVNELENTSKVENVPENFHKKIKSVIGLLNFCILWIKKNKGSLAFTKESEDTFRELIRVCTEQSDAEIKGVANTLNRHLLEASSKPRDLLSKYVLSADASSKTTPQDTPKGSKEKRPVEPLVPTKTAFDEIAKGSKQLKTYVIKFAQDFYCYQVEVFRAFDPRDLIKCHLGGEFGPSIKRNSEYSNAMNSFVVETILERRELADRVRVIHVFLLIAEKAADLGDYMTSVSIYGGLGNHWVDRLKQTWKRVEAEHPKLYQQYCKFKGQILNNYKGVVLEIESRKAEAVRKKEALTFLPFMQGLVQKLDINSGRDKVETVHGACRYNLQKIKDQLRIVKEHFSSQGNWNEEMKPTMPNTDIVFTCLDRYPKTNAEKEHKDDYFRQLSTSYERVKIQSS